MLELIASPRQADRPALKSPDRASLSYQRLADFVEATAALLRAHGVGLNTVVAIVLPNGPELATALLSVFEAGVAAPLNRCLTAKEFTFLLDDLHAAALLTEPGFCAAAVEAAGTLGVPTWFIGRATDAPSGIFSLDFQGRKAFAPFSGLPQGTALLLHTSGTTARPKLVPLTRRNLARSVANIGAALGLGPEDCSLNVMPLFHIHGLVAGLLSPLSTGGSVFCAPGFDGLKFFRWLETSGATWYTAVPTIHHAIVGRVHDRESLRARTRLRFVRSCSAPLSPRTLRRLEDLFEAPVISAYGMTEATHQISSDPLPPGARKQGSVGLPVGLEVAILDETGARLPVCSVGEVGLRGENLTAGYVNNPEANRAVFVNGWFRTGDLGVLDADGYLTLTGRIKEIINIGGEKVSPAEVDRLLGEHPDVEQVVCFAAPHPGRGETVAAAVVLRPGATATEDDILEFASRSLATFKVPSRLFFMTELPKGPSGKIQRAGLAERLGLTT